MSLIDLATNNLRSQLRILNCICGEVEMEVASVEIAKVKFVELFKAQHEPPYYNLTLQHIRHYYCLEELRNGTWDCACDKLD
jgi:hypothetical protein